MDLSSVLSFLGMILVNSGNTAVYFRFLKTTVIGVGKTVIG
jgi:hypothetical protein